MRQVPKPQERRDADARWYRSIRKESPAQARALWRTFRDAERKLVRGLADETHRLGREKRELEQQSRKD